MTDSIRDVGPLQLSAAGRVNFATVQQAWHGDNVMQVALFAGQQMMVLREDQATGFRLSYLGFLLNGWDSIEQAMLAAPMFAKRVLKELSDRVTE